MPRFRRAICSLLALLVVASALAAARGALASGGPLFSLPAMGTKNKSGLVISFDGRGVEGNGYRPLRVDVTTWPPVPLTADRQIRVVLKPQAYNAANTPQVSQIIDLPEGSTSVQATISMPQSALWYSMAVETYEDGEKLEDLSQRYMGWANTNYWDWTEDRPTMLFIDPQVPPRAARDSLVAGFRTGTDPMTYDLPDVRELVHLFPEANRGGMPTTPVTAGTNKPTDVMLLSQVGDMGRVEMLAPSELPERWLDLSQYDIITIKLGDLQQLAQQQPKAFAALREWLSTGPLLNVYDVGTNFERLAELEKLLQLPPLLTDDSQPEQRGWTAPDMNIKQHELLSAWEQMDYDVVGPYPGNAVRSKLRTKPTSPSPPPLPAAQPASPPGKPPFLFRRAGTGCVVAIAAENPFPGKQTDWILLLNAVPDSHWKWFRRTGYSLHRTNDDYWTFLIPGVGEAPVVSFLLLVSLFAIIIGPVNYIFLGRSRRLYLLLLTVPAGALLVTLCLFTYALLTDGLGVRLRARSFTALDQRSGEAAAWSRQSYYAAIAPSGGLVFPDDSTVFPIEYEPNLNRGNSNGVRGKLTWDEGQHLTAGYLPSRTATQFMVQRATKTPAQLIVKEGAASQPPEVENRLDSQVRYLLLRDSRGDYWTCKSLGDAAGTKLAAIDPAAAEKELQKLGQAVAPDLPRGYDPNLHHNNALSFLSPRYGGWNVDSGAAQPVMAASILERNLAECLLPTKRPLDPGTYTAVVESSPVVPIGVPQVRQEASLHVIQGRY
jgi:hypothetical protein